MTDSPVEAAATITPAVKPAARIGWFDAARASDLGRGAAAWRLWSVLGWFEISQRYRRSAIGPFWITISLGMIVAGLGVVYGSLFRQNPTDYIPYLATGFICWALLSGMINDACMTFISAEASIKMLPVPLSVYVYRMVWRNLIILAHNAAIYVAVILYFQINPGLGAFIALFGLALAALNGVAFGLLLGVLSARFRDIPLMVANGIQLVFFVTPILWKPEALAGRAWIYELNPFYYLIEVIRQPLLGAQPSASAWAIAVAFTIINLAVSVAFFQRFRWRIAYWI